MLKYDTKKSNSKANTVEFQPMLLVFTPSSWLIPRPTFEHFRKIFDSFYTFKTGLMVTSNEFFKLGGKFPIAFTVWKMKSQTEIKNFWNGELLQNFWTAITENKIKEAMEFCDQNYKLQIEKFLKANLANFTDAENSELLAIKAFEKTYYNTINLHDYTHLKKRDILVDWEHFNDSQKAILFNVYNNRKGRILENNRGDIRNLIPTITTATGKIIKQPRYNMYRNLRKEKIGQKYISGFAKKDERHSRYNVPYGFANGDFVGFMDNNIPIRLQNDTCLRMSNEPNRVWFMLMSTFSKVNLSQIHSGAANSRSFCAYDLETAKVLFSWFAISKAVNNRYPVWANQYDLWEVSLNKVAITTQKYFYSLCFAYSLAVNSCVVTKFEANNPVENTPEIFVDNPLCPTNPESFWAIVLEDEISPLTPEGGIITSKTPPSGAGGLLLVEAVKDLYKYWNLTYCKGQFMYHVGLQDEAYFKYFDYADFLTPYSGLVQIRKYAENQTDTNLGEKFAKIDNLAEQVKEEIYVMLTEVFGYFD